MKQGATRTGDPISCIAHGHGSVRAQSPDVFVNGKPMGRQSDPVACPGVTNMIVTGAALVNVNSLCASRVWESTLHPGGCVIGGSTDVFIGGPSSGMLVGATPKDAIDTCRAAAAGRANNSIQQGAGNCGIESARQIINRTHQPPIGESEMLVKAMHEGWAGGETRTPDEKRDPHSSDPMGSTFPDSREDLLRSYGVESERQDPTPENIAQALSEGQGVITSHFADKLWNDPRYPGGHAVLVVGVEYDANGKVAFYRINDTGDGSCFKQVPADQFEGSLRTTAFGHVDMNVTKERIW